MQMLHNSWLKSFFSLLLIIFLQFHSQTEGAKLGKKSGISRSNENKILHFADLDLLKRPLNLYITANGKHAVVLNKTLNNAANKSVGGTIEYSFHSTVKSNISNLQELHGHPFSSNSEGLQFS